MNPSNPISDPPPRAQDTPGSNPSGAAPDDRGSGPTLIPMVVDEPTEPAPAADPIRPIDAPPPPPRQPLGLTLVPTTLDVAEVVEVAEVGTRSFHSQAREDAGVMDELTGETPLDGSPRPPPRPAPPLPPGYRVSLTADTLPLTEAPGAEAGDPPSTDPASQEPEEPTEWAPNRQDEPTVRDIRAPLRRRRFPSTIWVGAAFLGIGMVLGVLLSGVAGLGLLALFLPGREPTVRATPPAQGPQLEEVLVAAPLPPPVEVEPPEEELEPPEVEEEPAPEPPPVRRAPRPRAPPPPPEPEPEPAPKPAPQPPPEPELLDEPIAEEPQKGKKIFGIFKRKNQGRNKNNSQDEEEPDAP